MKKRNKNKPAKRENDQKPTLKDTLNADLLTKLQETKKGLVDQEHKRAEELKAEKERARRLREQNKSFEELLEESPMNWQDYKK
ncbi:DUF3886 domain-containing protein [Jeotgalibacillus sp. S-D1]|uniref:YqkE family protein n=1 Tax=Jeotgalibacillus sp. S-D1 TaxID=2552189 RepID=UPI001059AEFD|nr:YqkE family protein [Jeotgalibacillus sp. S-D1]TDL34674.1 DUF3886 domain-containing protein [Jeotgalibacillus sp. S-D1]